MADVLVTAVLNVRIHVRFPATLDGSGSIGDLQEFLKQKALEYTQSAAVVLAPTYIIGRAQVESVSMEFSGETEGEAPVLTSEEEAC